LTTTDFVEASNDDDVVSAGDAIDSRGDDFPDTSQRTDRSGQAPFLTESQMLS
jgi:hypothetical protein